MIVHYRSTEFPLSYAMQYRSYKELFDSNPELYVSIEADDMGVDILKERMPFGKYKGMLFIDLIQYDRSYFDYMKNQIFNEHISSGLSTYNQRVKMLRVMISVERYYIIERYGEDYERRKCSAANLRNSAVSTAY